ncbi:hypothetical protein PIB30_109451, partial [Stylosanthes scabra]|nr:hypothetical protein [Stylosanthes scabra]
MGGIHAHESWGPYTLQRGLDAIGYHDPIGERQRPSVNKLSMEMRILHYLITYTLLPRGGNHRILQHDDILLMWAMLEGQGVDEVEEEVDRMEQEDQGHQPPQAQPTMFDLVQEMRSMNENLQAFQMETR